MPDASELRSGWQRETRTDVNRSLWAVVLAGGDGVRLRSLVRQMCGDERPKQFACLLGTRTLLRQTLDRVGLLVPVERTVVVTQQNHTRYLAHEFGERPRPSPILLHQPGDRGTAAAVLLAAQWIETRDPHATVVYFPSDHFILEEAAFMAHVANVAAFLERQPRWIVLFGAQASEPEIDYGWIEPGERIGWTDEPPVHRIRRFWEKPSREVAQLLYSEGYLWNTFVFAARVAAVLSAGREYAPTLYDALASLRAYAGSEHEPWAIPHAYALAPTVNFSRAILEVCSESLAVSKIPGLTWCDLGSPARVVKTLTELGVSTPWLAA